MDMKEMDPSKVGSWKRAVTSGDGVYHTRGYHSKNMSVLLVDYKENGLLAAVHLYMRGKDITTQDIPLFPGTSKAAEGFGFELMGGAQK
ncbi:Hypp8287 [Branchiostoma lanceolatum]|uniref:Hypp8287 protein n=1 Tax=Branchiostoma lanceolatum TaxID=7740 RepID=A0A8J9Z7M6_BRALA|nr:Hypp8287 [Branchiostoma lanceolatum]